MKPHFFNLVAPKIESFSNLKPRNQIKFENIHFRALSLFSPFTLYIWFLRSFLTSSFRKFGQTDYLELEGEGNNYFVRFKLTL